MNVVLLTKPTMAGTALASAMLAEGVPLRLVIVETGAEAAPFDRLGGYTRSLFHKVVNQVCVKKEERQLFRYEYALQQRANNVLMRDIAHHHVAEHCPIAYMASVNQRDSVTEIQSVKPDVIMVCGTSLLTSPLLHIPKLGCINAHSSLLPEYRGVRSEFWQCYYQDYTHVGITFHLVDTGVDTGGVLFQKRQTVSRDADPFILRARNTLLVIESASTVIKQVLTSELIAHPQGVSKTPVFRYRDITRERRLDLIRRLHRASHGSVTHE